MEQRSREPMLYDYRNCERIWQRVAPEPRPYPDGWQRPAAAAMAEQTTVSSAPVTAAQGTGSTGGSLTLPETALARTGAGGSGTGSPTASGTAAGGSAPPLSMLSRSAPLDEELDFASLAGADSDRCCMGTRAATKLKVIEGFAYLEMEGRRLDLQLARRAPQRQMARMMREYAEEEGRRVKEFMAMHYLITGECWQPVPQSSATLPCDFCEALRERYHVTACDAFNYRRAAAQTLDPCLSEAFERMSRADYEQANRMLRMLSQLV